MEYNKCLSDRMISVCQLVSQENIGGVVCLVESHEIEHSWALSAADWEKLGVRYHWLPTKDFFSAPPLELIQPAVDFINDVGANGKSVYVHCKAGRTRSANVVACYLMQVSRSRLTIKKLGLQTGKPKPKPKHCSILINTLCFFLPDLTGTHLR